MSEKNKLLERLKEYFPHLECEDSWYSCPLSIEGCINPKRGRACTCGAEFNRGRMIIFITTHTEEAVKKERCRWFCKDHSSSSVNDPREKGGILEAIGDMKNGCINCELVQSYQVQVEQVQSKKEAVAVERERCVRVAANHCKTKPGIIRAWTEDVLFARRLTAQAIEHKLRKTSSSTHQETIEKIRRAAILKTLDTYVIAHLAGATFDECVGAIRALIAGGEEG